MRAIEAFRYLPCLYRKKIYGKLMCYIIVTRIISVSIADTSLLSSEGTETGSSIKCCFYVYKLSSNIVIRCHFDILLTVSQQYYFRVALNI